MGRDGCVRCKDAGSLDSSAIEATEDAAACVHSAFQRPVLVLSEVPLARSFRCLKEDRKLSEPLLAERRERRHRGAGIDARRASEVSDLEGDAEIPRADIGQIRRTEVPTAGSVVRMTRGAARDGEEVRTS